MQGPGVQVIPDGVLSRDAVTTLSDRHNEPTWMRESRMAAFETYERLPLPTTKDEEWRRTDISQLRLDALRLSVPLPDDSPSPALQAAIDGMNSRCGLLVQRGTATVHAELDPLLRQRGVIMTDLHTALREHSDLVRTYFMQQCVHPEETKFRALHAALWSGGLFLYIPPQVEVTLPVLTARWLEADGLALFPHTLVVADSNSKVTIVEEVGSVPGERQTFVDPIVELILADGAQVRHVIHQRWGRNVWEIGIIRADLARDATMNSLVVALGGALVKTNVESMLRGEGASSEMLGLGFGDDRQHFDFHTLQEHFAPHTMSDLLYKDAVKDHARSIFAGLIRVHCGAQKTNAFQANRNLLLSEGAKADSDPKLEIMANDLRCTHGSATSRLNEGQLFYLMSRGLPRATAVQMAVEGFFAEIFDRVPLAQVKETLQRAIKAKMLQ